jgi:hypothetical protein
MVQFNYTHGVWINHMGTNAGYQVQPKLPVTEAKEHDNETTNINSFHARLSEERHSFVLYFHGNFAVSCC